MLDGLSVSASVGSRCSSGRPVSFLAPWFGPGVLVSGLYGLELVVDGERLDHPLGGVWREVVDDVVTQSRARGPEGMRVEAKGLSLTLHYRGRPEREADVRRWAEQQAARLGPRAAVGAALLRAPSRRSTWTRAAALLELAEDLSAACFLGDDVGDLPAFDALDQLAAAAWSRWCGWGCAAPRWSGSCSTADLVVDGPSAGVAVLQACSPPPADRRASRRRAGRAARPASTSASSARWGLPGDVASAAARASAVAPMS